MSVVFRGAMFRLSMIALIMALSCEVGFAEDINSANYVMKGCRSFASEQRNTDYFDQGYCAGLLVALAYADPKICRPPGVTNYQTARVVVQYIDQRPARLHENFQKLASEALRLTWPCKAQQ